MEAVTTLTGDAGLTGATALAVPSVSMNERQDVACVSGSAHLASFNQWVAWAQQDLDGLLWLVPAEDYPHSRRLRLEGARHAVGHALNAANRLSCPARKAMCLRVLNWLNADLRRLG